jgi:hypothetical protein
MSLDPHTSRHLRREVLRRYRWVRGNQGTMKEKKEGEGKETGGSRNEDDDDDVNLRIRNRKSVYQCL